MEVLFLEMNKINKIKIKVEQLLHRKENCDNVLHYTYDWGTMNTRLSNFTIPLSLQHDVRKFDFTDNNIN